MLVMIVKWNIRKWYFRKKDILMINKKLQDGLASVPSSFIYLQQAPGVEDLVTSAKTKQELINAGIALIVGVISIILKDLSKKLFKKRTKSRNNGRDKTNL